MKKCTVGGCETPLNEEGYPVQYCEYQQGRCPIQKKAFDINDKFDRFAAFVLVPIMLIFVSVVIYVELF